MKTKYLLLVTISGAIICLDQVTKLQIITSFRYGESLPVIADYFNITYVRNLGAAFGFLATLPETIRESFFLAMPPIALAVILHILRSVPDTDRIQVVGFSLIFGGAIGNYIDRLRFGYVVDFLDFHIQHKYVWPAFNVADSAIVTGVCLLLLPWFASLKKKGH